jgi:hypothetical protein
MAQTGNSANSRPLRAGLFANEPYGLKFEIGLT